MSLRVKCEIPAAIKTAPNKGQVEIHVSIGPGARALTASIPLTRLAVTKAKPTKYEKKMAACAGVGSVLTAEGDLNLHPSSPTPASTDKSSEVLMYCDENSLISLFLRVMTIG